MRSAYTHLQPEERMTLASLHQQGWSTRAMYRLIGLYAVLFGILLVVLAFKARRFGKQLASA